MMLRNLSSGTPRSYHHAGTKFSRWTVPLGWAAARPETERSAQRYLCGERISFLNVNNSLSR